MYKSVAFGNSSASLPLLSIGIEPPIVALIFAVISALIVLTAVSRLAGLLAMDAPMPEGYASGKGRGNRRDREKFFHSCSLIALWLSESYGFAPTASVRRDTEAHSRRALPGAMRAGFRKDQRQNPWL
jgi:hypothetical protein